MVNDKINGIYARYLYLVSYLVENYEPSPEQEQVIKAIIAWHFAPAHTGNYPIPAGDQQITLAPLKGIMMLGKIGCGKSLLFRVLRYLLRKPYRFHTCKEMEQCYNAGGDEALLEISRSYDRCFDDLGTEIISKYYGSAKEVMVDIIHARYDQFQARGLLTHFTSNISQQQIQERYGPRVYSRLREMCNLIIFPGEDMRGIGIPAPPERKAKMPVWHNRLRNNGLSNEQVEALWEEARQRGQKIAGQPQGSGSRLRQQLGITSKSNTHEDIHEKT